MEWWTIEVLDGPGGAESWWAGYGEALAEAAVTHGAQEWQHHRHTWGVLFEVGFADEQAWQRFRELPLVRAALDAVPDPVNGLLVYRGRGGSSGRAEPRRPRPLIGSGSAALPEPDDEPRFDLARSSEASTAAPAGPLAGAAA